MNRRAFLGVSATLSTTVFAGCLSSVQDDEPESGGSNDGSGPRGPKEAVSHYDNAIELLRSNADDFDKAQQQLLLGAENIDFSSTTITSRTGEVRNQLDEATREDDGSLEDEIEVLRRVASYQDALAEYNDKYLKLSRLTNAGIDYFGREQYQQAITTLQNAQQQIEPTKSSYQEVTEEMDRVLEADEAADLSNEFREEMIVVSDSNAEISEELKWLEQLLPARIDEIRGTMAFQSARNAFDDANYATARSQYSEAENHLISAETYLGQVNIKEETEYLSSLVDDSDRLECQYGHQADAADEMSRAAQAMQNNNRSQANQHIDNADSLLTKGGNC